MKEFIVTKQNEGQRFDKYLLRILNKGSMSFIFKMLRKKNFVLNDKKATGKEIIKEGDVVKLYISDDTYNKFKTDSFTEEDIKISDCFNIKDSIVYEDKDIILINKPANMLSQKAKKNDVSLNEYIINYLISSGYLNDDNILDYKPSVINRLDRNTTGIVIACKNLKAAQILSMSLKTREINKYYKCLVKGEFNKEGLYKGYLSKDSNTNKVTVTSNKTSDDCDLIETEYKLLEYKNNTSLVSVHLITGKSHQIRAHIAYLGFPIIGDNKYGNKKLSSEFNKKYQMLHAYKIIFPKYDDELSFDFSGKTFICEPQFRLSL